MADMGLLGALPIEPVVMRLEAQPLARRVAARQTTNRDFPLAVCFFGNRCITIDELPGGSDASFINILLTLMHR